MDSQYFAHFLEKTQFPPEACDFLLAMEDDIGDALQTLARDFLSHLDHQALQPKIDQLATRCPYHSYSIWLGVLILASREARHFFPEEEIFWDTFRDLRYKALECREIHGIWGTFVAHWYPRFFRGDLVKLGRLEFETHPFPMAESVSMMGLTLNPGDPVRFIHIPSSGEPFTKEARLDSYRRALGYFGDRPLICLCSSWLLYPAYQALFGESTNCREFFREFVIARVTETADFADGWRIFGKAWGVEPSQLPEDTSMRRAFKQHLLAGGTLGTAVGLLVFDGENILTQS